MKEKIEEKEDMSVNIDSEKSETDESKRDSDFPIEDRKPLDDIDEEERETLEDAKDSLLEAVEFMTTAIQKINKIEVGKDQTKSVKNVTGLLSDSSEKIAKTCHYLEKVENLKKIEIKSKEQTLHKINSLELELRKQGDVAFMLQKENEQLGNKKI